MADISVSFRQRAVIKFFVKEEKSAVDIHLRLQRAHAWAPPAFDDGWNMSDMGTQVT